jgi:hypothetical protein
MQRTAPSVHRGKLSASHSGTTAQAGKRIVYDAKVHLSSLAKGTMFLSKRASITTGLKSSNPKLRKRAILEQTIAKHKRFGTRVL